MAECAMIRMELPGYASGRLTPDVVASVRGHLQSCPGCRAELGALERLDALLLQALPPITPSAGFASRFASRLAAESREAEPRRERRPWLGWLMQPWLIPVAAAALVAAVMLQPRFVGRSTVVVPAAPLMSGSGTVAAAKKPASETKLAEKRSTPRMTLAASNPPSEVLQRPELFVDYAVIRDLDILESGGGDGESHAG